MLGMLTFTSPLILLALVALPALYFLLRATPPAARRLPFGGVFFLEGLKADKETPARTPWWLLLLRFAALAAIILGLAGPVMNAPEEGAARTGPLLIIVDDSWPAAAGWAARQRAIADLALAPGNRERSVRVLTTAREAALSEPMSISQAARRVGGLVPKAALADREGAVAAMEALSPAERRDIYWLSDGTIGRTGADRALLAALREAAALTVFRIPAERVLAITDVESGGGSLTATVTRIGGGGETSLIARGADGRVLSSLPVRFAEGEDSVRVPIDLPLTLRNDLRVLGLAGAPSAGATWLLDAGARRIRAGIVTEGAASLFDGGLYIQEALSPLSEIITGPIETLTTEEVGLIVLDDVGTLRPAEENALLAWVRGGGVLLRFAGPATASAMLDAGPLRQATFPVPLRGGERAFGGALTWADPQGIAPFPEAGPFAELTTGDGLRVRRQVLTRPSEEAGSEVWAQLEDGTPLVTARPDGEGLLVLFHVTATPTWSDLPASPLFPTMMARIARLAAGAAPQRPTTPLAPFRVLDGYGALIDPPATAGPVPPERLAEGDAPPGLYGAGTAALAVNTYAGAAPTLDRLPPSLLPIETVFDGPREARARDFAGPLLLAGLILLLIDAAAMILRRVFQNRAVGVAASVVLGLTMGLGIGDAQAQGSARPPLDQKAVEAALETRLAYVITGDRALDRLSEQALAGLTRESIRRSALEPGAPIGVDIARDDLSVLPLLYWPVRENTPIPDDRALARLEAFMAGGGLLLIDTADGERQAGTGETPAGRRLAEILRRMDIPPLEPVPADHILTLSFYRLDALHGRNSDGTVWVEAADALRESTDGVPSLIIGGRDWASAWAMDAEGNYVRPPGPGGETRREYAFRTGINIAMVAFTGNYKGDQVHVQALLDRLGTDEETWP